MAYLEGKQIKPTKKQCEQLIKSGDMVEVLLERDIDKSGRGYFFPKTRQVTDYHNRNVCLDTDWVPVSEIREMVIKNE